MIDFIIDVLKVVLAIIIVLILLPFAWAAILWALGNIFWLVVIAVVSIIICAILEIG